MGVLGLRRGVLRGILGLSRGVAGVFCRGIPGFLGGVRARRGDSAHGGQYRGGWVKKFLKKEWKRAKNRRIGVREVPEGGTGAPYIGHAR